MESMACAPLSQGVVESVRKSITLCSISRTVVLLPCITVSAGERIARSYGMPPLKMMYGSLQEHQHSASRACKTVTMVTLTEHVCGYSEWVGECLTSAKQLRARASESTSSPAARYTPRRPINSNSTMQRRQWPPESNFAVNSSAH